MTSTRDRDEGGDPEDELRPEAAARERRRLALGSSVGHRRLPTGWVERVVAAAQPKPRAKTAPPDGDPVELAPRADGTPTPAPLTTSAPVALKPRGRSTPTRPI